MIVINVVLVLLVVIPLATVIFWSRAAKMLKNNTVSKSEEGVILDRKTNHKFIKWLYQHKSKFNAIVIVLVTIIEFLALIPL